MFLFALYDPVWFILKPEWLIIILFVIMTAALKEASPSVSGCLCSGCARGALVYIRHQKALWRHCSGRLFMAVNVRCGDRSRLRNIPV
ncbi:hypothetical protein PO124_16190 [Bacillus licheniformis]|nr:hypothetical protein [Bacillus licheniformis]